jgi:hypothetical protein
MPLLSLGDFYHDAFADECFCVDVYGAEHFFSLVEYHLGVVLGVAHNLRLALELLLAVVEAHDPDAFLASDVVRVSSVAVEYIGDFRAARLLILRVHLLPLGRRCTRSRIKLTDVQYRELMPAHQLTRFLVLSLSLQWEPANDVSRKGHIRHLTLEVVANFIELLGSILSIHFVEHFITARLDGHMQELVHPRVFHDVTDCAQMLQDVGRVRHAQAQHAVIGHDSNNAAKQVRQICVDVSTIGACIFTRKPDFHHALFD